MIPHPIQCITILRIYDEILNAKKRSYSRSKNWGRKIFHYCCNCHSTPKTWKNNRCSNFKFRIGDKR